ncbi:YeiH family protein [Glaciimonas immobilis]|uniref:Putative integral membrane protein (TIGR00698 family) n=1 Tax=Glaciimonas immobilis TaxID=728004 RepID=A0A840RMY2_9BURK|nr:putative sulfate exporter family transporter [Glaciimonas immobilis]KAF3998906.1 putative sulfate exporter family transporter [Glaciimonas immobilis]MBB5198308.1 putative integral membrane protein (TIGR00698 family) [Glaciimonas immobilis]
MSKITITAVTEIIPGLALCGVVTGIAYALEAVEERLFGRAWLESLVLAIVIGIIVRTFYKFEGRFEAGICFGAKTVLEIAVVLLGASISASAILEKGPDLIGGIAVVVLMVILGSYGIGRVAGLPSKMAVLIACGNSICGNSAIAAVAPVIHASSKDVAASIAFTAVFGVAVVLILPLLVPVLSLSLTQYGIFAGMTVYAVPQVLAATAAVSQTSAQIGTLVKLVRVLMLGPVVLVLSLSGRKDRVYRTPISHMVPWFIIGFLLLMALRSFNLIPQIAIAPAHFSANFLTIVSMAALGLGVDVRSVLTAGGRVTIVVVLSLLVLSIASLGLIKLLGIV